jgi:hypothetical protein
MTTNILLIALLKANMQDPIFVLKRTRPNTSY